MNSLNLPISNKDTIEECLHKVKQCDNDALAMLYEQIRVPVYNFAMSIVRNRAVAEDILQETIIKIYESIDTYKSKGKPMAWILTITKNNALMKIRNQSKITEMDEEEWNKIEANENINKDERILLKAALKELTDEERQIITLYVLSGLKHREIAKVLEIPLATTLSKYHRALKKLRAIMAEEVKNG